MRIRITLIIALAITLSLAAGSAAGQAMPANVVAAVKNETRLIARSARTLRTVSLDTAAHAEAGLPTLARIHGVIAHAAADVSHASVQSPVQRSARRRWVAGTRDQAAGIAQFELAARAISDGHRPRARAHLLHAVTLLELGAERMDEADGLLDLAHDTKAPRIHGG